MDAQTVLDTLKELNQQEIIERYNKEVNIFMHL